MYQNCDAFQVEMESHSPSQGPRQNLAGIPTRLYLPLQEDQILGRVARLLQKVFLKFIFLVTATNFKNKPIGPTDEIFKMFICYDLKKADLNLCAAFEFSNMPTCYYAWWS